MNIIFKLLLIGLAHAEETPIGDVADAVETKFNWIGLVALLVMYGFILGVGIWASKKQKENTAVELALAGRSMSGFMGVITMVATWVCGGYLYGTVSAVVVSGLAWTQAPWCFSVTFFFGAMLFCKKMREKEYITMFDPFGEKFSAWMTALMYIPAFLGDIFWIGMALSTLGACLSVLLGIPSNIAIFCSAIVAAVLAFSGGLYSVAYTDVVQLVIMFICLWLVVPFVWKSDAVPNVLQPEIRKEWLGSVAKEDWGVWMDFALLMVFGGIPWQVYFQRVLSSKTVKDAKFMSIWSGIVTLIIGLAPAMLGVYAVGADFLKPAEEKMFHGDAVVGSELSYVMKYLTPGWVSYFGLSGIAAATLSTADGAFLASSTVFTLNVYKPLFRPHASEKEITNVAKITMCVIALGGSLLAVSGVPVYSLWVLTSDLVYVLLFPQLLLVVYFPNYVNTYGSFIGFILGTLLRVLGGEESLSFPAVIKYPHWLPFRTLAMICCLFGELFFSWLFSVLVNKCNMPDCFGAFKTQLKTKAEPPKTAESK